MCMYIKNIHCIFCSQVSVCSFDAFQFHSLSCLQSPSVVIPFTLFFTIILLCYLGLASYTLLGFCLYNVILPFWQVILMTVLYTSILFSSDYPSTYNLSNTGFIQQMTLTLVAPSVQFESNLVKSIQKLQALLLWFNLGLFQFNTNWFSLYQIKIK